MVGRVNIIRVSGFPKLMYRLHGTLTKIPESSFVGMATLILKFVEQWKGLESQNNVEKGGIG